MIKIEENVPKVYYNMSRDFQLIGRLYDLVVNYVKTNTDLIKSLPLSENSPDEFLELMSLTLGFKPRHIYNVNQLRALSNVFTEIIRNKGSIYSIVLAGYTLLNAEGLSEQMTCYVSDKIIKIFISDKLSDLNLFIDLLDYILPAGMSASIVRALELTLDSIMSVVAIDHAVRIYSIDNLNASIIIKAGEKDELSTHVGKMLYNTETADWTHEADHPGYAVNGGLISPENAAELIVGPLISNLTTVNAIRNGHEKKLNLVSEIAESNAIRNGHEKKLILVSEIAETNVTNSNNVNAENVSAIINVDKFNEQQAESKSGQINNQEARSYSSTIIKK